MQARKKVRGFTLIEIMIALAIIAILARIAYPAYTDQIRKGKRAQARAAVMNLLQQEERYATQMNTYAAFAVGAASGTFKDFSGDTRAVSSHLLGAQQCQAVGGNTPTLRDCIEVYAQPQTGVFTDPEITMMAIDTQGRKRCTGTNTSRCWQ